jgi:hypothetical protein
MKSGKIQPQNARNALSGGLEWEVFGGGGVSFPDINIRNQILCIPCNPWFKSLLSIF